MQSPEPLLDVVRGLSTVREEGREIGQTEAAHHLIPAFTMDEAWFLLVSRIHCASMDDILVPITVDPPLNQPDSPSLLVLIHPHVRVRRWPPSALS